MSKEARLSPVELLRQLTLSVERLAAQGLASGAVRGATEELRAGLPELDGQLQAVFEDVLTVLGRMAHEAAERPVRPPEEWSRRVAEGAVRGAVEELRRSMPGMDAFSREVVERLNQLLERSTRVAANREKELRAPGARARIAAAGAVRGALGQLHDSMPQLASVATQLSSQVGRGFVEGLGSKAEETRDAFATFVEHAARRFVHALVEQLDTELKARWGTMEGDMGRATAELAEQVAEASVRGVSSGILAALGEGLRKPFVVAAGASSVLLLAALLVTRTR